MQKYQERGNKKRNQVKLNDRDGIESEFQHENGRRFKENLIK